jgi:hypothetical protein
MHNLLNQAFDQAVKWSLVKVNPVKNAKPPKVKSEEKITWTVDEVNRLKVCFLRSYLNFHTG